MRGGAKWGNRVFRLPIAISSLKTSLRAAAKHEPRCPTKKPGNAARLRSSRKRFSGYPNSRQHRRHNLIFIIQQREQIQIFRAD